MKRVLLAVTGVIGALAFACSGSAATRDSNPLPPLPGSTISNCQITVANAAADASTSGSLLNCISQATPGYFITCQPGTYPSQLSTGAGAVPMSLDLRGCTLQQPIVLDASYMTIANGRFSPAPCSYTTVCTRAGILVGKDNPVVGDTIVANTFDGTSEPEAGASIAYGKQGSTAQTITRNTFTRCGDPDPAHLYAYNAGVGICINFAATSATVAGNRFSDYCYQCKDLNGSAVNSTITGNYFGSIVHYTDPTYGIPCGGGNPSTTLTASLQPGVATVSVAGTDGFNVAVNPDGSQRGDGFANVPITIGTGSSQETDRIVSVSGNVMTIARGMPDSPAYGGTWPAGTKVGLATTCTHTEHWFVNGGTHDVVINANTVSTCGYNDGLGPIAGYVSQECTADFTIAGAATGIQNLTLENNKFVGSTPVALAIQDYNPASSNNQFVNNTCAFTGTFQADNCWTIGNNWAACSPGSCAWTIANNVSTGSAGQDSPNNFSCFSNVEESGSWAGNCAGNGNVVTTLGVDLDGNANPTPTSTALLGRANVSYAPGTDFYGRPRGSSPAIGAANAPAGTQGASGS